MGILLKLSFSGLLILIIVVLAQGQTVGTDTSSESNSNSNSNSGSDSAAITTAAPATPAPNRGNRLGPELIGTPPPTPLLPATPPTTRSPQLLNPGNQETVTGAGNSIAEANEALLNQTIIPPGGAASAEAAAVEAAQTAGGNAGSTEEGSMPTAAAPPIAAANVPTREVAPLGEDPTYRTMFIGTSAPDYTTKFVAAFKAAGTAAPQEAVNDNLASQEMSHSTKVGIAVGVGVAATGALAMSAAAVYYSKTKVYAATSALTGAP